MPRVPRDHPSRDLFYPLSPAVTALQDSHSFFPTSSPTSLLLRHISSLFSLSSSFSPVSHHSLQRCCKDATNTTSTAASAFSLVLLLLSSPAAKHSSAAAQHASWRCTGGRCCNYRSLIGGQELQCIAHGTVTAGSLIGGESCKLQCNARGTATRLSALQPHGFSSAAEAAMHRSWRCNRGISRRQRSCNATFMVLRLVAGATTAGPCRRRMLPCNAGAAPQNHLLLLAHAAMQRSCGTLAALHDGSVFVSRSHGFTSCC